jgi:predicted RNase H-like HicB family nuclease
LSVPAKPCTRGVFSLHRRVPQEDEPASLLTALPRFISIPYMQCYTYLPIARNQRMRSYIFKVVFEKDTWPDEHAIWRASIPVLPAAHAWGNTQQEAFVNLKHAVDLIIEDLLEEGTPIPTEPAQQVQVSSEPLLTVTI